MKVPRKNLFSYLPPLLCLIVVHISPRIYIRKAYAVYPIVESEGDHARLTVFCQGVARTYLGPSPRGGVTACKNIRVRAHARTCAYTVVRQPPTAVGFLACASHGHPVSGQRVLMAILPTEGVMSTRFGLADSEFGPVEFSLVQNLISAYNDADRCKVAAREFFEKAGLEEDKTLLEAMMAAKLVQIRQDKAELCQFVTDSKRRSVLVT